MAEIHSHRRNTASFPIPLPHVEDVFRLLIEHMPGVFYTADLNACGRLRSIGPQIIDVLGFPPSRCIDDRQFFQARIHPHDRERVAAAKDSVGKAYSSGEIEYRMLDHNDHVKWIRDKFVIQAHGDGETAVVIGVLQDMSEIRNAEAEAADLRRIIEDLPTEIYMFDPTTLQFITVNRAARENLGYSMDELAHKTPLDVEPDYTRTTFDHLIAPLRAGATEAVRFDTSHLRRDGSRYPVRVKLQYSSIATRVVFIAQIMDITETQDAEEKLRQINAELEERVLQRTKHLATANHELKGFAYAVSHDLRAPLRAIRGFAHILNSTSRETLDDKGRQYLDYVILGAVRMERLIDDLLTYSKLTYGNHGGDMVSLAEIFRNIRREFDKVIKERHATVSFPEDIPDLPGELSLFEQIIANLLDNALTYCDEGVKPQVTFSWRAETGFCVLSVTDNGTGIDSGMYDDVFNIFQRLVSDTDYQGTGIGLAIVRKAVNLLGGTVWVESQPGVGSTFFVRLPMAANAASIER